MANSLHFQESRPLHPLERGGAPEPNEVLSVNTRASNLCATKTFIMSRNHLLFVGLQAILSDLTTTVMVSGQGNNYDALHQEHPQLIIVDMDSHQNVMELIDKIKQTVPLAHILLLGG